MATARPRGREEVIAAVLDSARELIAERGPGVALRDIADGAGVNFGLLYHYLGTKEQLVDEVYARAASNAAERFVEVEHLEEALRLLMTFGDGTTARLVGWAALEGGRSAEVFRDSPALEVLTTLMKADAKEAGTKLSDEDARVFVALTMAISLAWRLFGTTSLFAAGLDGSDPDRYAEQIQGYVERLATVATGTDRPAPTKRRRS